MPNLKEVRIRIESVKSTMQITSAMKLVAASKLRRAQQAILTLRPFAARLTHILQDISGSIDATDDDDVFTKEREIKNVLLVVISSNRGLCGAFNANVIKKANELIRNKYQQQYDQGKLHLYCIGKKVYEHYQRRNYQIVEYNPGIFNDLTFNNVAPVAEGLMQDFADGKYDRIEIIYNQFKNAGVQILADETFLPIQLAESSEDGQSPDIIDYIFEPEKEEIVRELLPKSLKVQLYKAILDSFASEHGARMTAMHKATDNAQEMLKDLRLSYNKARQASITNELIEIVSGSNALNE
ncbi:MAG: ATP synthase F1 subunit gamma [Bacteroidota bacterium]|nr:ATP synthase F1 subunit gamma [Bacteroidota bacterium]